MSNSVTRKVPPTVLVASAVLLWSTGGLFIKLTSLDAFAVNFGRSALAAIIVAVFTQKRGLRLDRFTIVTSILYAGTLSCFVYATKNTTSANAIFLQYTAPIYILILAPFILKERLQASDLITVAVCLSGMLLFFFDDGKNAVTAPNVFLGNIAALVSGIFFGLYILLLRHRRSLARNPAVSVFYGNLLVVVLMLPVVLNRPPASISALDLAAITFLGVFQIGIAYILFTSGIAAGVRPLDASIIGFVEPLFNPFWVFIFIGERPSRLAIVGGLIILSAVAAHTFRRSRQPAPSAVGSNDDS